MFWIFWPPLPLSLSQISWFCFLCLLFGDHLPQPTADVIYGSPQGPLFLRPATLYKFALLSACMNGKSAARAQPWPRLVLLYVWRSGRSAKFSSVLNSRPMLNIWWGPSTYSRDCLKRSSAAVVPRWELRSDQFYFFRSISKWIRGILGSWDG